MKRKLLSMALAIALSLSCALIPKANVFAANEASTEQNSDKLWTTRKTVNGIEYSLTVDLREWDESASRDGIHVFEDLFFEVYPQMYDRFGFYSSAPTDVILCIKESKSKIACAIAQTSTVIINKQYYADHMSKDVHYDVLVHELAHLIQNDWKFEYLEYDDLEIFANYLRYVYAYKDGIYNDSVWTLNTAKNDGTRDHSSRFLVWLDLETSSSNRDVIRDYFEICFDKRYERKEWDKAWKSLFKGTKFEGKTIDEVWNMYYESDFGKYNAKVSNVGEKSELIQKTDARNYIKKHSYSESYEAKLKGITLVNPNSKKDEPAPTKNEEPAQPKNEETKLKSEEQTTQNKEDISAAEDKSSNESKRSASYEFGKNIVDGRYVFNTHILDSGNMSGKKEAFYIMCDALINGEDSFNCPNKETFNLITSSEILSCYFPFADGKIKGAGFENGVGKIEYLIPKDEFIAKEIEYEKQIEDVLNSKVTTDQKAFMKAIALFNYCRKTYTDDMEFNKIYTYLLLQCGVPAHLDMSKDNKLVTVVNISGSDYTYDPDSQEFKLFSK